MRGDSRNDAAWQGLILALCVFAVGLLTRTRDFGGDDTVYAQAVEAWLAGRGQPGELFATHHMTYNPIVACATWLVRRVAPGALVLDVGAAVSSFFWALTAGGLSCVLRRHGVGAPRAMLVACSVAACGGMWCIATRMEVNTLASAAVVGWLAACTADRPRPFVVGIALAGALLAHVALGVLTVPTLWRLRRVPRVATVALAVGLGIPALAALAVFTLGRGAVAPSAWLELVLSQESLEYVDPSRPWLVPRALAALVLWGWYRQVPVLVPSASHVLDIAGTVALVLGTALTIAGLVRVLYDPRDRLGRTSAVALVAFLPLWLVWDVGFFEHTVAAAPLFGVLAGAGAASLPLRAAGPALAALAILLASVNGIGSAALQRRPENGRLWVIAGFVAEHVGPRGLILALGTDGKVRQGLSYLSGRHVADLTLAVRSARLAGRPPEDALAWWVRRARGAGELWALDEVIDPRSEGWIEQLGIAPAAFRAALADVSPRHTEELAPDGAVVRTPFRIHRLGPRGEASPSFSSVGLRSAADAPDP